MSARRVIAVARRIAEGFRRDERSLGLLFAAPLLVTALLGWVIRDSAAGAVNLVVADAPAAVLDALRDAAADVADDVEVAILEVADAAEARELVRDGDADIALVVSGTPPALEMTVITEGTDPASEAGSFGVVQQLLVRAVASLLPVPGGALPEVTRETIHLSPDANQLDVLAPVFLGIFAYFFVFILTGISFLRERIGGTLERLLATPVTRGEIVLGYSLGFGFFATLQVLVLTLFVFGNLEVPAIGPLPEFTIGLNVQTVGSPWVAFLVALLLAIGAVNLGIFLSTFARTELQILQFIPIVIVPQTLLGGVFWPVERLPDVLAAVAQVLPVTYAVDALREVMLKGADLTSSLVQTDLAVLAGIAVLFVGLAAGTIKREVA
ncbi:MAG: ABC transporter permease [Chloroflexi bacterium]|nr:ABC transporter permease [Chloroflexota bacterium]